MGEPQRVQAMVEKPAEVLTPVNFGPFTFTAAGVTVDGVPTFEQWAEAIQALSVMERGLAFIVGDLLLWGEAAYGELAAQFIDARDWADETVRVYRWLAKQVPRENRMLGKLTVKHHLAVAALPPREQRQWLQRALKDDEPWSASRLTAAIKANGDPEPSAWFLLVECRSEKDQAALRKQMELDGRACRQVTKR